MREAVRNKPRHFPTRLFHKVGLLLCAAGGAVAAPAFSVAQDWRDVPSTTTAKVPTENTITIARALDKVTARITELELPQDQEVQFGSLLITARHCQSRPPEEPPETFAFLEIEEQHDQERRRLFTGWMLASSPGLHALEHPVYDVWVIACKTSEPISPSGME